MNKEGLHADVLIIGAGAAGGVAALRLARAGCRVVALEQGRWHDRHEYRGNQPDWELTSTKQWASNPNLRSLPADYPIDVSESDISIGNFNGVGGATILYNAIWLRMQPSNFRTRTLDGVADDWPLAYEELLPFYEATDRQIGVSGLGGNPAYPASADPPLPPLPVGDGPLRVARALAARGWHWWPDTNAIVSMPYDGRHPCVQRGTCAQGCNEGAKSSTDLTHWRHVVEHGGEVITGARVRRIVLDQRGLAAGAEWLDAEGNEHFQSADVVLLAASGVGTPRLLLMSDDARYPDGLANRSGLVGKRLMAHPVATVSGIFDMPLGTWQGQSGSFLHCLEFVETDLRRGFVRGAKWSLRPGGGPLADALAILSTGDARADFHRDLAMRFGRSLRWTITAEDLPEESNRVELSKTVFDSTGLPAPKVVYRWSENSRRNLDFNVAKAGAVLTDAGAVRLEIGNPAPSSAHLMGTARMGDDPTSSVVDRWCMTHDVPNLGIIDSSVFVTAGAVNPASTICALALRAAEHLLAVRSQLPVPTRRIVRSVASPVAPRARGLVSVEPGSDAGVVLDRTLRDRLARLADALIPATTAMRAPSHVGVHQQLLDFVLAARADLAAPLVALLAEPFDDPVLRLDEIRADRSAWQTLVLVVAGGYLLDGDVTNRLGYPGQEARPVRIDGYPAYVQEGLLDHLVDGTWAEQRGGIPGTAVP